MSKTLAVETKKSQTALVGMNDFVTFRTIFVRPADTKFSVLMLKTQHLYAGQAAIVTPSKLYGSNGGWARRLMSPRPKSFPFQLERVVNQKKLLEIARLMRTFGKAGLILSVLHNSRGGGRLNNQDSEMHDRLSQKVEGEFEMPYALCQECVRINAMTDVEKSRLGRTRDDHANPMITVQCYRGDTASVGNDHRVHLEGVLTCTRDGHRWPITIERNIIISTGPEMPVSESKNLHSNVPKGLRQDIEEAERCYLPSCFKACVVMCRRALQLALEDLKVIPINGRTLGPYLAGLKQTGIPDPKASGGARYLAAGTYALAEGIKDIGDAGAHQPETIDSKTAELFMFVAVKVLNELYP